MVQIHVLLKVCFHPWAYFNVFIYFYYVLVLQGLNQCFLGGLGLNSAFGAFG